MSRPRQLKHLPEADWPRGDLLLFEQAFTAGDIFEDAAGAGGHLRERSKRTIIFGWRRFLGFLTAEHPDDLLLAAVERITPERVRSYIEHLSSTGIRESSVAITVTQVYNAARLVAPDREWGWLKAVKRRLHARAKPQDRFDRLVPAHRTLDLGIELMDTADTIPGTGHMLREIQFRDGLILALLSLWPTRRRSLGAPTTA
jgi:hypothetical protein